jgi:hypothetical protein
MGESEAIEEEERQAIEEEESRAMGEESRAREEEARLAKEKEKEAKAAAAALSELPTPWRKMKGKKKKGNLFNICEDEEKERERVEQETREAKAPATKEKVERAAKEAAERKTAEEVKAKAAAALNHASALRNAVTHTSSFDDWNLVAPLPTDGSVVNASSGGVDASESLPTTPLSPALSEFSHPTTTTSHIPLEVKERNWKAIIIRAHIHDVIKRIQVLKIQILEGQGRADLNLFSEESALREWEIRKVQTILENLKRTAEELYQAGEYFMDHVLMIET